MLGGVAKYKTSEWDACICSNVHDYSHTCFTHTHTHIQIGVHTLGIQIGMQIGMHTFVQTQTAD